MKTVFVRLTYLVTMDIEEDEDLVSVEQAARDMVETGEWRPNDVEIEWE
jgi:predicted transport protein